MCQGLPAIRLQSVFAALLITASCSALAFAESADQWRAAGSTPSPASQSTATAQGWRLPNGQSNSGDTALVDEDSNPLRKTQANNTPNVKPQEPRAFQAPANAAPMSAAKSLSGANSNYTNSAAVASHPGPIKTQSYGTPQQPRQQPNRAAAMQRPFVQPNYRQAPNNQARPNSPTGDLYHAINVAFQEPAAKPNSKSALTTQNSVVKKRAESLPLPGDGDYPLNDPVMRYPGGPGEFAEHLGGPGYQPYGEQGMCCDGSCPTGCAGPCCGECCEPGCGCPCGAPCEPGCDCPNGKCGDDTFCIGPGDDESCHVVKVRWPKWQEVVAFGGVQGFKGPYDRDRDSGNFGFNEGFNIGAKVPYCALGYQFGYRAAQSQLNGDTDTGIDNSFNQNFVTAGLFHRQAQGLNFGVVWDGLVDERKPSNNFHQIRSELSVINGGCHELGFGATVGLNSHGIEDEEGTLLDYTASDQYVLFYRLHGPNGGEGRIYAGVNNDSDGILGADTLIPIGGSFSLSSEFAYLIPNEKNGTEGASHEAWNVGVGLVWHWDGQARKCFDNCYRPLFNVADNGTLIVDQQNRNN